MSCDGWKDCAATALANIFPDTATIMPPTRGNVDSTGVATITYGGGGDFTVSCLLTEARADVYRLFGDAIQFGSLFRCRMPLGTVVDADSRIEINGSIYRVARPSAATSNSVSEDFFFVLESPATV